MDNARMHEHIHSFQQLSSSWICLYIVCTLAITRDEFLIVRCSLGGLCFALNATPPYIKLSWLAGGFIGVGGLNVVFYPFYWKYLRAKAFAKENEIPKIAFPEEVVYGMNTQYIKNGQPAEPVRVKEETVEPNATELSTVSTNAETVEPPKEAHTIDIPSGKGKEPMKRFDDEKFEEIEISPEPIGAGAC